MGRQNKKNIADLDIIEQESDESFQDYEPKVYDKD